MKSFYVFLIIGLLISVISCSEELVAPAPKEYCPPPNDTTGNGGSEDPIVNTHMEQKVSPDGEKLLYIYSDVALRVLNLKTGKVQNIDFSTMLPANIKYVAVSQALWCPYNSNRLLARIVTMTDTVGDGKKYVWGQNLYVLSLDGKEITRVTPEALGPAGHISPNIMVYSWLPESTINYDKIQLFFQLVSYIPGETKIFIPQTQEMFEPGKKFFINSNNGLYYISMQYNPQPDIQGNYKYFINDTEIKLKDQAKMNNCYSSFSPDGKKLALSVQLSAVEDGKNIPYYLRRFSEIWIIDVEKFLRNKPDTAIYPDKIISYRKAFCMYNYEAGHAEYITNDRLAVSMFHTVYDGYGFLYEITEDGRMVRQLTFEP